MRWTGRPSRRLRSSRRSDAAELRRWPEGGIVPPLVAEDDVKRRSDGRGIRSLRPGAASIGRICPLSAHRPRFALLARRESTHGNWACSSAAPPCFARRSGTRLHRSSGHPCAPGRNRRRAATLAVEPGKEPLAIAKVIGVLFIGSSCVRLFIGPTGARRELDWAIANFSSLATAGRIHVQGHVRREHPQRWAGQCMRLSRALLGAVESAKNGDGSGASMSAPLRLPLLRWVRERRRNWR